MSMLVSGNLPFPHVHRAVQNSPAMNREDALKISYIFKKYAKNLLADPLSSIYGFNASQMEEIMDFACLMKHCYKNLPFSVKFDPYTRIFEVNCQRFMALLEMHEISSEERALSRSGGLTWEYLLEQSALPPTNKNYLAHFAKWIFFSNEKICEKVDCETFQSCIEYLSRESRETDVNPCETDEKFIEYRDTVLLFVNDSVKNIWEIMHNFSTGQIGELITTSHLVQEVLSKALMRRTTERLEKMLEDHNSAVNEIRDLQFLDQLNQLVGNFHQNLYLTWKNHVQDLLCEQYRSRHDRMNFKQLNLLQIAYRILTEHFHKPQEMHFLYSSYLIKITKLHYAFLLFFLDWIDVLLLDNILQPTQFSLIHTLLSEISLERICSGVLTHFHPQSPQNLQNISIENFPNSKREIQALSMQPIHIIGINQIFFKIFHNKDNELPPILRKNKIFKRLSKFKLSFMLEDVEIKTVKISKTLFRFLRHTQYDYLNFSKGKTIYFWFEKYFNFAEFQVKKEEERS